MCRVTDIFYRKILRIWWSPRSVVANVQDCDVWSELEIQSWYYVYFIWIPIRKVLTHISLQLRVKYYN